MKKKIIIYGVKNVLCCDRCKKPIEDGDSFVSGAFQCGVNLQGEIGSWCSEKCFEMYEKSSPLLTK